MAKRFFKKFKKAFKRTFKKKSFGKKFKNQVQKVINKNLELKYYNITIDAFSLAKTTPYLADLITIAQGITRSGRIGDQVRIKYINVQLFYNCDANDVTVEPIIVKAGIYRAPVKAMGADGKTATYLGTTVYYQHPEDFIDPEQLDNVQSKTWQMSINQGDPKAHFMHKLKHTFGPKGMMVQWDQTLDENLPIGKRHWLSIITNTTNTIQVDGMIRVHFTDA